MNITQLTLYLRYNTQENRTQAAQLTNPGVINLLNTSGYKILCVQINDQNATTLYNQGVTAQPALLDPRTRKYIFGTDNIIRYFNGLTRGSNNPQPVVQNDDDIVSRYIQSEGRRNPKFDTDDDTMVEETLSGADIGRKLGEFASRRRNMIGQPGGTQINNSSQNQQPRGGNFDNDNAFLSRARSDRIGYSSQGQHPAQYTDNIDGDQILEDYYLREAGPQKKVNPERYNRSLSERIKVDPRDRPYN